MPERSTAATTVPDSRATAGLLDVVYVIGTYPQLTTTFIDREIDALRRAGISLQVVSIRRPEAPLTPEQARRAPDVAYLLPIRPGALLASHAAFLRAQPRTYVRTLRYLLSRPHPSARARLRTLLHFGEAVPVARLLAATYPAARIHAHFVDRAAVVALVASRLLGVPYSATAHANDIYVEPVLLAEKVDEADFVATCTAYNRAHLESVTGARDTVLLVRHGLDLASYVAPPRRPGRVRPLLLAVGQLQPKKGFADLIEACRLLRSRGVGFACEIIGEGPLRPDLERALDATALGTVVRLRGALDHAAVIDRYGEADLFVLPSVTAPDGGRDGIPNVVLEAMAMALPVVSTRHSGIPEAVDEGRSGLLVPPGDPAALADALAELLADEGRRRCMGQEGRRVVLERFDANVNARQLIDRFVGG